MKLWKIWVISAICVIVGAILNIFYFLDATNFYFSGVLFLLAWALLSLPLMFAKELTKNTEVVIDWKK